MRPRLSIAATRSEAAASRAATAAFTPLKKKKKNKRIVPKRLPRVPCRRPSERAASTGRTKYDSGLCLPRSFSDAFPRGSVAKAIA